MTEVLLAFPLWIISLSSLIPLSLKLLNGNREIAGKWVCGLGEMGILLSAAGLVYLHSWLPVKLFGVLFLDLFRLYAALCLLALGALVIAITPFHAQVDKSRLSEILFLYLNALMALMVFAWSSHLMVAFVSLELFSMSFYLLIAFGLKGNLPALKAAFKYFVLGSVASALLLYGMAFVMGVTGHFDMGMATTGVLNSSPLLFTGVAFIFVGLLFKVSVFPFQFWLPDVYRGAFTPLLIFMAAGTKIAVFTLLYQWVKNTLSMDMGVLLSLLQWLAVGTMLFGNILAVRQEDFKKLLLFSTIAHSGYLLMILLSAAYGSSLAGSGLFYYLMLYAALTAGSFLCLLPYEEAHHTDVPLDHVRGMAWRHPLQAFFTTLFLLGLAGIPPLGGFMAKLFLFHALVDQGFWWLLFWSILGSTIAFYYYLKPIALMYMSPAPNPSENVAPYKNYKTIMGIQGLLALFVVGMGVYPLLVPF